MFLADVVGTVVSPVQHPFLDGRVQLVLRPVSPTGERLPKTRIGIDHVGAGVGDRVLVIDEGNSSRQMLDAPGAPVRTVVAAIVDRIELNGREVYDLRDGS